VYLGVGLRRWRDLINKLQGPPNPGFRSPANSRRKQTWRDVGACSAIITLLSLTQAARASQRTQAARASQRTPAFITCSAQSVQCPSWNTGIIFWYTLHNSNEEAWNNICSFKFAHYLRRSCLQVVPHEPGPLFSKRIRGLIDFRYS
jgi:hypothetical protein